MERLHRAATLIQQSWRRYVARKTFAAQAAAAGAPPRSSAVPDAAAVMAGLGRRGPPRRLDSMLAAVETVEAGDPHSACLAAILLACLQPAAILLLLNSRSLCLLGAAPPCPSAASTPTCRSLPLLPAQASRGSWWMSW